MRIIEDVKPKAFAKKTNAQSYSQGITYNEAGLTYNEVGYAYGGVYDQQDIMSASVVNIEKPLSFAARTNAYLNDESITYNESGLSYNETGYAYGGLYGQQDILPLISLARVEKPTIVNYADIYTPGGTVTPWSNISIGPGWFMFITQ